MKLNLCFLKYYFNSYFLISESNKFFSEDILLKLDSNSAFKFSSFFKDCSSFVHINRDNYLLQTILLLLMKISHHFHIVFYDFLLCGICYAALFNYKNFFAVQSYKVDNLLRQAARR